MEDKGRVRLPKLMNFRKNSKRPFTPPPHFRKIILLHFFPENPSLKHYINSHLPETNIEENTSMILPERLWVSISWMKESQTIYILSHIAQEKKLTRKDVLRLLMWGIRSSTQIWHNRWARSSNLDINLNNFEERNLFVNINQHLTIISESNFNKDIEITNIFQVILTFCWMFDFVVILPNVWLCWHSPFTVPVHCSVSQRC